MQEVQVEVGGEEVVLLIGMERVILQPAIVEIIGGRTAVARAPFKDINGRREVLGGTHAREVGKVSVGEEGWSRWHEGGRTLSIHGSWSDEEIGIERLGKEKEEENQWERMLSGREVEEVQETREERLARKMMEDILRAEGKSTPGEAL